MLSFELESCETTCCYCFDTTIIESGGDGGGSEGSPLSPPGSPSFTIPSEAFLPRASQQWVSAHVHQTDGEGKSMSQLYSSNKIWINWVQVHHFLSWKMVMFIQQNLFSTSTGSRIGRNSNFGTIRPTVSTLIARWRHNPSKGFHGAPVSVMNRPLSCLAGTIVIDWGWLMNVINYISIWRDAKLKIVMNWT